MKANVVVTYKPGVLEPQGQTVCQFLRSHGESKVLNVRVGKLIEFELDTTDRSEAKSMLEKIGDELLANPVIESFKVELL